MYKDVLNTQCDPSGAVDAMETCRSSGPAVFGAMLGVAFAAQVSPNLAKPVTNFALYDSRLRSFISFHDRAPRECPSWPTLSRR